MAFTAEISRTNPTCLLFLVDQSSSMDKPFGGQPGKKKSEGVADAINRLLQNLTLKCAKSEGIRDYFQSREELKNVLMVGPDSKGAMLEGSKDFSKNFI